MSVREPSTIHGYYNSGDMDMVRKLCREWYRDKTTNPITSKPLTAGAKSKIYQQYDKLCRDLGIHSRSSTRGSISVSQSESSNTKLAKHMSNMDITDNMDTIGRWAFKKCANENPITLMPFDNEDVSLITIRVRRNDGKFIKKGMCITRESLFQFAQSDKINSDYHRHRLPSMFMSNWIPKSPTQPIMNNGMGGYAGGKIFVKIPPNNIYISLKSFLRMMVDGQHNEWYAVPMFNNTPQRVGNMFSMLTVVGTTHGQAPGAIIYKLHTREEVENTPHLLGKEDKDEYHILTYVPKPKELMQPITHEYALLLIYRIVEIIPDRYLRA